LELTDRTLLFDPTAHRRDEDGPVVRAHGHQGRSRLAREAGEVDRPLGGVLHQRDAEDPVVRSLLGRLRNAADREFRVDAAVDRRVERVALRAGIHTHVPLAVLPVDHADALAVPEVGVTVREDARLPPLRPQEGVERRLEVVRLVDREPTDLVPGLRGAAVAPPVRLLQQALAPVGAEDLDAVVVAPPEDGGQEEHQQRVNTHPNTPPRHASRFGKPRT